MVSCYYNPIALSTASSAWCNQQSSLPARAFKATTGALYDIFVKNPTDLSIGNARRLFSAKKTTGSQKVALAAMSLLGSFYAFMFYGAALHISGRLIGTQINHPSASKVATALQKWGKNLFVIGGVPTYGLFYALPKKIVQQLPEVLRQVADKVGKLLTRLTQKILVPLWNRVIYPVFRELAVRFEALLKKTILVVRWCFRELIIPFCRRVVYPLLKAVQHSFSALAAKTKEVASYIFNKVLAPAYKSLTTQVIPLIAHGFEVLSKEVVAGWQTVSRFFAH